MIQGYLAKLVRAAATPDKVIVKIDTSAHGWRGLSRDKSPSDFDPKELRRGTRVELEHIKNKLVAQRIAMDHLTEDAGYYQKLAKFHHASEKKITRRTPAETKKIGRPPKHWMKMCMKSISAPKGLVRSETVKLHGGPGALCGWVWYHQMSDARRAEVMEEARRLEAKGRSRRAKLEKQVTLAFYP